MQAFTRVNKVLFWLFTVIGIVTIFSTSLDLWSWPEGDNDYLVAQKLHDYNQIFFWAVIAPLLYIGISSTLHYFISGKFRFTIRTQTEVKKAA